MAATRGTRVEQRPPTTTDAQAETVTGELYEILTEQPNGHRTVVRVRADSRTAAEKAVSDDLADGVRVLGASAAGCGLGSGD